MASTSVLRAVRALWAMTLVAGLEAYALSQGVDGVALAGTVAVIAGLGGYYLAKRPPGEAQ